MNTPNDLMKKKFFKTLMPLTCMLFSVVFCSNALADNLAESHGGDGGANFKFTCPADKHLIGLGGRSGEWVDHLTLICGKREIIGTPPNRQYVISQIEEVFKIGDSNGGGPMRAQCPANSIINRIDLAWGEYDGGGAIINDYIRLTCVDPQGNVVGTPSFGVDVHGPADGHGASQCNSDRAVGLHGRAGLFVDRLGLICR